MTIVPRIVFLCCLLLCYGSVPAQKTTPPRPSQTSDTVRYVEILNADVFLFRTIDSITQLQILVGRVKIRQGTTLFDADSVIFNERNNFMEAFGNVHVNDADSINIYSQYMRYEGTKKTAFFKNKVKLTDGNSVLFTDEMDYDMNGKIGTYRNGGRIESKQTTLTSKQGFYYADIKDIYFIGDVKMSDQQIALASDSLLYNTTNEVATFIAPTTIKSGNSISNVSSGYYDLKLKKAKFGGRSIIRDNTSTIIANDMVLDDKTGNGEAKGNVQYKDTAQGILLFSNRVFFNKTKKNFLATEKPVMVVVQEKDSIYIAADTIYSGLMKDMERIKSGYINEFDTVKGTIIIKIDSLLTTDSTVTTKIADSVTISKPIAPKAEIKDNVTVTDKPLTPLKNKNKPAAQIKDTIQPVLKNSIPINTTEFVVKRPKAETDTLRFITAFRNVRIFNDSLQAVADSMFYSGVDSIFQLYKKPIAWSKGSQITGDTIFVYTKNKKPSRLNVFENALMIQSVNEKNELYNQLQGRIINGYFIDGQLDFVKAKGTAESIYYAQDNDSAFVGMNRTGADMIEMFFANKEPKKVKFTSSVKGTTYPIRQLPKDQKKLPGFQWHETKRPKSKLELFL